MPIFGFGASSQPLTHINTKKIQHRSLLGIVYSNDNKERDKRNTTCSPMYGPVKVWTFSYQWYISLSYGHRWKQEAIIRKAAQYAIAMLYTALFFDIVFYRPLLPSIFIAYNWISYKQGTPQSVYSLPVSQSQNQRRDHTQTVLPATVKTPHIRKF